MPDSEYDVRRYTRSRQTPTHKAHDDTIPWHQIKQKVHDVKFHGTQHQRPSVFEILTWLTPGPAAEHKQTTIRR